MSLGIQSNLYLLIRELIWTLYLTRRLASRMKVSLQYSTELYCTRSRLGRNALVITSPECYCFVTHLTNQMIGGVRMNAPLDKLKTSSHNADRFKLWLANNAQTNTPCTPLQSGSCLVIQQSECKSLINSNPCNQSKDPRRLN